MFSEISFPVFRPGHSYPAETQTPSSLPFSKQTDYQNSAACQLNKPEPSDSLTRQTDQPHPNLPSVSKQEEGISKTTRVEPAPRRSETQRPGQKDVTEPGHTNIQNEIGKIHDVTKIASIPSDSNGSLDIRPKSLNKHTHYTRSHSPQISNLPTQSLAPGHNKPAKDEQLKEEERFLLAKIHMMTGDTSPASAPRGMKRLIPTPGDIDSDATEPQSLSKRPAELTTHSQHSVSPCFEALQEISLSDAEEPLGEDNV